MNDKERQQIQTLRKENKSYGAIAQVLGLSVNTVKTYCQNHALGGAKVKVEYKAGEARPCACCGTPVIQNPKRKAKRFCSKLCCTTWWNSHLYEVNRRTYHERECPGCHKIFKVYGKKVQKYCCHACYIKDRFRGGADE